MLDARKWRQLATGLFPLLCCAFCVAPAIAQQASEQAVKAGFIYNFIRFTQWSPARDADVSPLLLCTPSNQPLDGQFARLSGRAIGSRTLEVRMNVTGGDLRNCDVLFLAESDASRFENTLRSMGTAPVLTISDQPGFVKAGGMIGLHMEESRVKFDVNLVSAQRAGLLLNSQMLKLAGQVIK